MVLHYSTVRSFPGHSQLFNVKLQRETSGVAWDPGNKAIHVLSGQWRSRVRVVKGHPASLLQKKKIGNALNRITKHL